MVTDLTEIRKVWCLSYEQKIHLEIVHDEVKRGVTWIRHLAKGHDLIQQNSKGPNIRFYSELVFMDALWSRPLHGELRSFFGFIHILTLFLQTRKGTRNTDKSWKTRKQRCALSESWNLEIYAMDLCITKLLKWSLWYGLKIFISVHTVGMKPTPGVCGGPWAM